MGVVVIRRFVEAADAVRVGRVTSAAEAFDFVGAMVASATHASRIGRASGAAAGQTAAGADDVFVEERNPFAVGV